MGASVGCECVDRAGRAGSRVGLVAALVALAALPGSGQERAQRSALELQHRAETRARYAQSSWARSEARAGLPNDLLLPGWEIGRAHV